MAKKPYQPPRLRHYGGLPELTRGMPHPGAGPQDNNGKIPGGGDDLASAILFVPGSPFVVQPR